MTGSQRGTVTDKRTSWIRGVLEELNSLSARGGRLTRQDDVISGQNGLVKRTLANVGQRLTDTKAATDRNECINIRIINSLTVYSLIYEFIIETPAEGSGPTYIRILAERVCGEYLERG